MAYLVIQDRPTMTVCFWKTHSTPPLGITEVRASLLSIPGFCQWGDMSRHGLEKNLYELKQT